METSRLVIPAAEEVLNRYFPVLDHGFVALKDYMGGDLSVEESARVSYGGGTRQVSDGRTLLRYLLRHRHSSPFEMVEFRFHIGLPIFVMRQLIRHRTANVNEYSGRYSVMPLMFYTPEREQVCSQSKKNKQGRAEPVGQEKYYRFWRRTEDQRQRAAINYAEWVNEIDIARETARLDLPLSTYTYCYWKIDLRNMFNVLALRCDSHAQWEIRVFADIMAGIVQALCPLSFEAFQDYQQTAVTLTQVELQALHVMAIGAVSWNNSDSFLKSDAEAYLCKSGCTKREIAEFWEKLKPIPKRDYSLDLSKSKDGEYFKRMVESHAVEVPTA
jgi:thymidylate synthase (FAD)